MIGHGIYGKNMNLDCPVAQVKTFSSIVLCVCHPIFMTIKMAGIVCKIEKSFFNFRADLASFVAT